MLVKKQIKEAAQEICEMLRIDEEQISEKVKDQQWDELEDYGNGRFRMTFEREVEYQGELRQVDLEIYLKFYLDKEFYLDIVIDEAYLIIFMNEQELDMYPDEDCFVEKVDYRL